jgi:nitrate reductase gamma subunit
VIAMRASVPLCAVAALMVTSAIGAQYGGLRFVLAVVVPLSALCLWVAGLVWRVVWWAKSPVPFRIPTTCGQQKSCSFVRTNPVDNPQGLPGVVARMALEVLLFRSLLRNDRAELHSGPRLVLGANRWLWLVSLLFHYSMLMVLIRHLRLFMEPVPGAIAKLVRLDGVLEVGLPPVTLTSVILMGALVFLLLRRLVSARLRYVSLAGDYWALLLLLGIAGSGVVLRHWARTDVPAIKDFCLSLAQLRPMPPDGVHWLFFTHLVLVSVLFAYFPFSKLVHMGGVLFSPTRNLANNSRRTRHVNPWAQPARLHPYAAYEDMFRDKMIRAGIPVDKGAAPSPDASAGTAKA